MFRDLDSLNVARTKFSSRIIPQLLFFCYTHLYLDQILGYFPVLSNKTQLEHAYRTGCITEHPIGEQATLETQLSNAYYNEKHLELRPYLKGVTNYRKAPKGTRKHRKALGKHRKALGKHRKALGKHRKACLLYTSDAADE